MAFSKLTGKGIDLTTNVITEFNSTGIDDNATSTAITIAANNSVAIPNLHGNTTTIGNLTVGGDFIVQGNNFTVDADSLRVEDSLIQLASNNETSDVIDIGFFGHYSNDGNTALHTGFFRDASDEQYYLFNGLEDANLDANNSVTTINRSGTGFTLADLNVGNLFLESDGPVIETTATNNSSGLRLNVIGNTAGQLFRVQQDGTTQFIVEYDGKVGIGTDAPAKTLTVNSGTASDTAQFGNDYNSFVIATPANLVSFDLQSGSALRVRQGATQPFAIDTSGNALVGDTNNYANSKLYVNNSITTNYSGTIGMRYNVSGSTNNYYKGISGTQIGLSQTARGLAIFNYDNDSNAGICFYPAAYPGISGNPDPSVKINSSGAVLVGTAQYRPATNNVDGVSIDSTVGIEVSITNGGPLTLNRKSSNGSIASFKKDGTTIGNIGSEGGDSIYIGNGDAGLKFSGGADAIQPFDTTTVAARDAAIDLGTSGARFKNLYLSGNMVVGASGSTYSAGALGYSDANWGFIYRPPQAGGTGAHLFEAYDGTDLVRIQENSDVKVLGNAGRLIRQYSIPNTGGSSLWIRLGTAYLNQNGQSVYIKLITNQGYNADNSQDAETFIRFKTGNSASYVAGDGSSGNFYANGRFARHGNAASPSSVRAVQLSSTSYEIWVLASNFTGGGSFYEVSWGQDATWTHSGTTVSTSSPPGVGSGYAYKDFTHVGGSTTAGSLVVPVNQGIYFDNSLVAANHLDDYEEGTWTPTTPNGSWTVSEATYTKIGRMVFCRARVVATSAISSADFGGLPFTVLNSYSAGSVGYQNSVSSVTFSVLVQSNSYFNFRRGATQYGLNNGAQAMFSFVYETSE